MAKGKKIGINFFLNQRLKPSDFMGQQVYPVYARITFDRKNHQCPAPIGFLSESQFEEKVKNGGKPEFTSILKGFEEKIRTVITEEYNHFGDKFSFKGFSKRLDRYEEALLTVLDKATKAHLIKAMSSELKKDELKALSFDLYSFWDTYDIIRKNFLSSFEKVLDQKLKIKLSAFVYLSGFLGKKSQNKKSELDHTKVIDWFLSDMANSFKSFLIEHSPIESKEEKLSLGFFENESHSSPVWELFFALNVNFIDIPLMINSLEDDLIMR